MKLFYIFIFLLNLFIVERIIARPKSSDGIDTLKFQVTAYDGLKLPAQILIPSVEVSDKVIVFINGSTPYDEKGNMGPVYNEKGQVMLVKQDFYLRFLDFMTAKGYCVATMAKRSLVEPEKIPRPTLDELALDVVFLIKELKSKGVLTSDKKLFIIGYSEGSIVASKVLGWLKEQPEACILLGSGTNAFDFNNKTWDEWPSAEIMRKTKNWNDEQIKTEFEQWKDIVNQIQNMDENTFENVFKKSRPHGFGFAQWESIYIDKEVNNYYPESNIIDANIPVLICIGTDDRSMPEKRAAQTYRNLLDRGFTKVTYKVIPDEVHQYKKFDVFGIIDSWIISGYKSTEFQISASEKEKVEAYLKAEKFQDKLNQLPYRGLPDSVLSMYNKVKNNNLLEPHAWFTLGVKLFGNGYIDRAKVAFQHSAQPDDMIYSASLAWLGHLYDLIGDRITALQFYTKALETYPGFPVQHDLWNILLDEKWIKERIEKPFTIEMTM